MIHLDYVHRPTGVQTAPVVCMHCEDPTCAKVCPADAIKQDDRGVVHVETIGYNQDGKVVCIFRRKVMVPKDSYLEARGGEQPGRPVPQPDRNWPGAAAD